MATEHRITADYARQLLDYDPVTGRMRWKMRPREMFRLARDCMAWNTKYAGNVSGLSNNGFGYLYVCIDGRRYGVHRIAWLIASGVWPEREIDHINGDRGDNRLCNLREATPGENQQNRPTQRNSSSGMTGVGWHKASGMWRAYIKVQRRTVSLGYFADKNAAYSAYLAAKKGLHGFQPSPRIADASSRDTASLPRR